MKFKILEFNKNQVNLYQSIHKRESLISLTMSTIPLQLSGLICLEILKWGSTIGKLDKKD